MIFLTETNSTSYQRLCTRFRSTTSKEPSPKVHMIVLFFILILATYISSTFAQQWTYRVVDGARELSDCEGLGFPNASKNECGFCTGGSTGLLRNHSKDCLGSCDKKRVVDCAGVCGGAAYIDECSGECIGGTTGRSDMDVNSFRDCRGYCQSSGGQFATDGCGVCHSGTSPFQDCTNQCRLPSQEHMMAKLICGRCVGGTTDIEESEVLDNCGNCRGDGMECPCNGTGKPDACGVCNGGGSSCMRVLSFTPRALPVNTNTMVDVEGAFRGRSRNLKCIFVEILLNDELGNRTEFTANGDGTYVRCSVKLPLGSYRVGVKIEVGDSPEMDYVEGGELLVYDDAEYTAMSPTKAVFDRDGNKELVVTFSGGKVPPLPLTCIITGEGWPTKMRLSQSEVNTLDMCVIPYPSTSLKLNIAQSFNGIHAFKRTFTLKFYASPPEMRKYYIAEDGHAVVIVFDRPVNLCNLDQCSNILNSETLGRLGDGATCKWATKQQMIITVQNPITVNPFRVTFKKGILKQDAQKYALPKNESLTIDVWYPQPVSSAQVAISGPSTIPNCGVFTLVGHFSSPKGDAEYYWTAYRADQQPLEAEIANALLMIRTASLTLDASLLEVEQEYIFILTAEHPINEKYEARHIVSRRPYIGPLVTAYSNVMTQSSVTVDEAITLQADLTLPECSTGNENMYLMWSVNNPKVKFNFRDRRLNVYEVAPYSLPENTEVVFIAHAFFSNMLNVTQSKIHLRVEPTKLKAAIKGTAKRIVGNKAGNLVLESEYSNVGIPVIYQWKCYDKNYPICYNYKRNSTEPLLVPRKLQSKPKLVISCESLKAGHVLTFELRVFNANNRFHSQTASVTVLVENKNIPQVIVDSVIADGSIPIQRHPTTGAYSIPAGLPVAVHATINAVKTTLKSVKWEVKGYSSSFTYTTMNGKSILSLDEGFLVGHGIYLIGLSACDGKGACGVANLTIHAIPGVALCKLEVQPYVEYEMIKPVVSGCSVPPGRQPLTYQIFLHSIESVFPITPPQTPTVFNIFGPPRQTVNGTEMSVQVCDKYLLCTLFPGSAVRVSSSEAREEDRSKLIMKAEHAMKIDDPMSALSLYLIAATDREAPLSETETENMLNAGAKATVNRYISAGQLSLVYSAMHPLVRQSSDKVKMKAITVMKRGTKLAFGNKIKIPAEVLSRGHSNVAEALQCRDAGSAVADAVRATLDYFVERISASVPLGTRVFLSSRYPGYPASLVFRQLMDRNPIYIKAMSGEGMVEGSVRFEDAIRDKVRKRKCAKKCEEGIVVALTLYPTSAPYPTTDRRTSPVLDITLREPEGGKLLSVTDVPNAVRLALTHSGNYSDTVSRRILYRCSYWDAGSGEWSSEGLVTFGVDGNVMRCWSSHLTSFAVMETYDGLSTGSIVGIVVTALMGVFIIMMLAFFFFRKKQAANARVSNEALQSKRSSEKMNGSVRVKTVAP